METPGSAQAPSRCTTPRKRAYSDRPADNGPADPASDAVGVVALGAGVGTEALAGLAIGELDFVVTGVLELARAVGIESASRVIAAVGVVERVAREVGSLVEFAIEGLLVAVGDIPGDSRRLTPGLHPRRPKGVAGPVEWLYQSPCMS